MIPYRQQEILQALADNPKGLTTEAIYKIASSKPGSEVPDKSTVGKLCFTMRNLKQNLVTTSDAVGGNIHKITNAGIAALAEAVGSPIAQANPEPIAQAMMEMFDPMPETPAQTGMDLSKESNPLPDNLTSALNLVINAGYTTLDPANEIDTNFASIIEYIRMADALQPAPTIERKQEKIDALTRIAALMSDDIKFVLDAIANDLEQLEAA